MVGWMGWRVGGGVGDEKVRRSESGGGESRHNECCYQLCLQASLKKGLKSCSGCYLSVPLGF